MIAELFEHRGTHPAQMAHVGLDEEGIQTATGHREFSSDSGT